MLLVSDTNLLRSFLPFFPFTLVLTYHVTLSSEELTESISSLLDKATQTSYNKLTVHCIHFISRNSNESQYFLDYFSKLHFSL